MGTILRANPQWNSLLCSLKWSKVNLSVSLPFPLIVLEGIRDKVLGRFWFNSFNRNIIIHKLFHDLLLLRHYQDWKTTLLHRNCSGNSEPVWTCISRKFWSWLPDAGLATGRFLDTVELHFQLLETGPAHLPGQPYFERLHFITLLPIQGPAQAPVLPVWKKARRES